MGEKQEFERMKMSPAGTPDPEQAVKKRAPIYKRRKCRVCCCICVVVLLSVAIVAIALSQTIFKFRDPQVTMENVKLQNVSLNFDLPTISTVLDISVSADVRVDNPNYYDFRYYAPIMSMMYHGDEVGVIQLENGTIRSRKTVDLPAVITVQAVKLLFNALQDIASNVATFDINSVLEGRINLAHIYKKHVTAIVNCTMDVFIRGEAVLREQCWCPGDAGSQNMEACKLNDVRSLDRSKSCSTELSVEMLLPVAVARRNLFVITAPQIFNATVFQGSACDGNAVR